MVYIGIMEPNISTSQKDMSHPLTTVTPLSKTLAAIVFIVLPFVGFYLGYINTPAAEVIIVESQAAPVATSSKQTKRSFLGGEIPENWSEYTRSETPWVTADNYYSDETITYSFGSTRVSFPPNFEQVNIRFMTKASGDSFIKDADSHDILVEQKTFDEVPLTVIYWPLDENGQATILGTGGTDYIMQIPKEHAAYPGVAGYLHISKVGRGDAEFEKAFEHFIDSIDFKQAQNLDWIDYATMGSY